MIKYIKKSPIKYILGTAFISLVMIFSIVLYNGNAFASEEDIPITDSKSDISSDISSMNQLLSLIDRLVWSQNNIEESINSNPQQLEMMLQATGLPFTVDGLKSTIKCLNDNKDRLGHFKEIQDILDNNGTTMKLLCLFRHDDGSETNETISISYDNNHLITGMSIKSKIPLSVIAEKAGLNTLLGMGTVFVILFIIMIVIYLLRFLPNELNSKKEVNTEPQVLPVVTDPYNDKLEDDNRLIAVITAAIVSYEASMGNNISPTDFEVKTISRRTTNKW